MAGVSDEILVSHLQQLGFVTMDQIEKARLLVSASENKGSTLTLCDALILQNVITSDQKSTIEKKLQAQQEGGLKTLGNYKLIRKLGEGGMGTVYLAEDMTMLRKVALKVLPKKYASDLEFLTRFRREAKAAGKLNHVNVISAFTVGEELGNQFYVMEYCEGEPLDKVLKREGVLPWDRAIEITIQIARGLKHAHEHGLIHRDIKPANIFMASDPTSTLGKGADRGIAKILDLGLSKNIGDGEQSFNTQTGMALGTPHYISPEQAKGEKNIDGRTDIYSLGATLYHLVTGQTPFMGSTPAMLIMQHLTDQIPNPQDIREDIPDSVVQVIQKMMAKEPVDRYANCAELLGDLELVIQGKLPSSQILDIGKSSVAMPRVRKAAGADQPRAARRGSSNRHEPIARRGAERHAAQAESVSAKKNKTPVYAVGGVAVLGLLVLVFALMGRAAISDVSTDKAGVQTPAPTAGSATPSGARPGATTSPDGAAANEAKRKQDEMSSKQKAGAATAGDLPKELNLDLGNGAKMEMVLVPAGEFKMGSSDGEANERPIHKVRISQPYYIGKYEVTVAQFRAFSEATKYQTEAEKRNSGMSVKDGKWQEVAGVNWRNPGFKQLDNHPVGVVSWNDAQDFCKWATKLAGRAVRLPTEAEWEYAARGPQGPKYPWGDMWDASPRANVADASLRAVGFSMPWGEIKENDGFAYTSPVGNYKNNASWCGAFDMAGNQWEWCQDYWSNGYGSDAAVVDPLGPKDGAGRVLRGACWNSPAPHSRSTHRANPCPPDLRYANFGFRVVMPVRP